MTKTNRMCAGSRKVYYSTAHERTSIIYDDDDRLAVADIRYANLCSERERPMCSGQGVRSYALTARGLRAAAGGINRSDTGLQKCGAICG